MKKRILYATLFALLSFTVLACWFTQANYNYNYIAGLNNYMVHYNPSAIGITNAVYYNNMIVDIPITVWVKIGKRYPDQPGEEEIDKPIKSAKLQYRILPNGNWVTVKSFDNPSWQMNFADPIPLFGKNNIFHKMQKLVMS